MKLTLKLKGGKGSGFHGHAGRPGKVGGSLAGVSSGLDATDDAKAAVAKRIGNGVTADQVSNSLAITNANMNVSDNKLKALFYGIKEPGTPEPRIEGDFERIDALFSGINPNNPANDVIIDSIGGTKAFFRQFDFNLKSYTRKDIWTGENAGGITWLDPFTGETFYMEASEASGWDWGAYGAPDGSVWN